MAQLDAANMVAALEVILSLHSEAGLVAAQKALARICSLLGPECASAAANRRQLLPDGAQLVLKCMKVHASDATVQARGCLAACRLLVDCADGKEVLAAAGAVQIVADAIRRCTRAPDVQQGFAALAELVHNTGTDAIAAMSAAEGALDAIEKHAAEPMVAHYAMQVLYRLMQHSDATQFVWIQRAATATAAALERHPTESDVQDWGKMLLMELMDASQESLEQRPALAEMSASVNIGPPTALPTDAEISGITDLGAVKAISSGGQFVAAGSA